MVNEKKQTLEETDIPRRRGRPAGKYRIPLSREQRRARNAQYERERRIETTEAMSELIEAANCDPKISNATLLATVINRIQRTTRNKAEDITELERINTNLEAQIATAQDRLGLDDAALKLLDDEDTDTETAAPDSSSKSQNTKNYNLGKQVRSLPTIRSSLMRKKRKRSEQLNSESIQPKKRTLTRSETISLDSGIEMRGHTTSPPAVCDQDQNNMQYFAQTEQQQLPEKITEEREYGESQARRELQTELYNQIYNSEFQNSEESITKFVSTLSAQSQSIPSIERLARSLIEVPSIVPPQQVPSDSQIHSQSNLTSLQNVELPCDLNLTNECDLLQQNDDQELSLDFLTDAEKRLLSDLIGADFLETSEFCEDSQMQVRSNPNVDMLSGC